MTKRSEQENIRYLQDQIVTYLGNKRNLLGFIGQGVEIVKKRLGLDKLTTLDMFSGSGIVARYLKAHSSRIIVNDLESYSRIINECYLSNRSEIDWATLSETFASLEHGIVRQWAPGFITELYAPADDNDIRKGERAFFTRRNAIYLDTARTLIETLPADIQPYFLGPLMSEASIHANTSGVFKGFYKNNKGIGQFGGNGRNALFRITRDISVKLPVLSNFECQRDIFQKDANELVGLLPEIDLAYFDPPYNQHPYGSNYFMLNILADYEKPPDISRVSGIPIDWNRSDYNRKDKVETALFNLVEQCPAKFILISYNSEGYVTYERFLEKLTEAGKVTPLQTDYNAFRGSRNLRNRPLIVKEYLFLLEKK